MSDPAVTVEAVSPTKAVLRNRSGRIVHVIDGPDAAEAAEWTAQLAGPTWAEQSEAA